MGRFCLRTSETSQRCPNSSVLLTYQLRRRDDVSTWPRTFKFVTKMGQWVLSSRFFWHLQWFNLLKVLARTLLQRLKDVSLIQVPAVTSLRRIKLVSLTQVSIDTLLQRLKLVGLNYVPVRRHKDVSNRSISFTSQSLRRDDVSAWSATSRPI